MVVFIERLPHPVLHPFVKAYWYLSMRQGSGVPLTMSPSPEQCLYFYPRAQPLPLDLQGQPLPVYDNIMMGQAVSGGTKMIVPDEYCMVKILFQPGGMFRLFGVPMTHLANRYEETAAVLGSPIEAWNEQLMNTSTPDEAIRICNEFLISYLSKKKLSSNPIDWVLTQPTLHQRSIDQLAADACLSSRQFERKFLERVGVSPKMYQRVIRFNQAMKFKNTNPSKKWIDITYACGYFDQMHLLRDFRQFTGTTPSIFDFDHAVIY
ncbi:MAG: AraC family transcriptional regulator [Spirosomataceae bacterium]